MVPIDINTAPRERIRLLRGIGWVHAARITAARPFKTPYELVTRAIISEHRFDKIAADITTGHASGDRSRTHLAKSLSGPRDIRPSLPVLSTSATVVPPDAQH
jgi:hypothetical protein